MEKKKFDEYRPHIKDNEVEILKSKKAACLFCRSHYSARAVKDWHSDDGGVTALCPECGMAAVVGDASALDLTHDRLREVNKALYDDRFMKNNPEAIDKYLDRYESGQISRKKENEALYLHYLQMRAGMGDADCAYRLATELLEPGQFHDADLNKAVKYFNSEALSKDAPAKVMLGWLHLYGKIGPKPDYRKAFEYFSQAVALGSKMGALFLSDMYLYGHGVKKDSEIAYAILESLYSESYSAFYASKGSYPGIFGHLCYRLGNVSCYGFMGTKEPFTALRYYLLADLAFRYQSTNDSNGYLIFNEWEMTQEAIEDLGSELGCAAEEVPVYDFRTFSDSAEPDGEPSLAVLRGKTSFMDPSYDEETHTFGVELYNPRLPSIVIDIESLYAEFVDPAIRWEFNDVVSAKFTKLNYYDWIEWKDSSIVFWAYVPGGEPEVVCELKFEESGEEPESRKKGSGA